MSDVGYFGALDMRSDTTDNDTLLFMIKQKIAEIATATIVKVIAVYPGGTGPVGTVDVQPMVNQIDGKGAPTPHGTIYGLPYIRLQAGSSAIILDPQVGDIGYCGFCSTDISSVKANKAVSNPGSRRRFSWSDGVYLGAVLGGAPTQYVSLDASGAKVVSPTAATVQAPAVTLAGSSSIALNSPSTNASGNLGVGGNASVSGSLTVSGKTSINAPEGKGAVGNGASNPASGKFSTLAALQAIYPFATDLSQELDFLGWQAAANAGGVIAPNNGHYVMCNANPASQTPLVVVAGQTWIRSAGAILDFSAMTYKSTTTNYVPDNNFATAGAWANASIYAANQITNATFNTGAAVYTDPATFGGPTGNFCQFGQLITLAPGFYTANCTFDTTLGASKAAGNPNPPFAGLQWFVSSPGGPGSLPVSLRGRQAKGINFNQVEVNPGVTVTQTMSFDFQITSTFTGWLTFSGGGYANFAVHDISVKDWFPNCGIMATRDGAPEHYPIRQPVEGLEIIGPGLATTGLVGVRYTSFTTIDGNQSNLANCSVHEWDVGISFEDGAYLLQIITTEVYACGTGAMFHAKAADAGENNRFYGGAIFNCHVGIDNGGGAEFAMFGTAIDYCRQAIISNYGRIEAHGCHWEMNGPATAGLPLFQCFNAGTISMFGGMILLAGPIGAAAEPPISLVSGLSRFIVNGTQLYNVSSAAGVMASGAGTISGTWLNVGNPNLSYPSLATAMDAFGGFGSFEPPTGFYFKAANDPTGINIPGGMYPQVTEPQSDRWNTTGGNFKMALSTAQAHDGTQSLAVTKGIGTANNYQIIFMVPVNAGQSAWFSMYWLSPSPINANVSVTHGAGNAGNGTVGSILTSSIVLLGGYVVTFTSSTAFNVVDPLGGAVGSGTVGSLFNAGGIRFTISAGGVAFAAGDTFTLTTSDPVLYARGFWGQRVSTDSLGRPVMGQAAAFVSETDITIPRAGSGSWTQWKMTSMYVNDATSVTSNVAQGAPTWATHFCVVLDTESLPPMTFYLDTVTATVL